MAKKNLSVYQAPICLLSYIGYTWYAVVILIKINEESTFERNSYLLFVHVLLALIIYCYYKACYDDPGKPSQSFSIQSINPIAQSSHPSTSVEKNKDGKSRFCTHCNIYKPDRTHHCRKCNRCVLKMDHHCLWTNGCIGFYTYKYFMLLLYYACIVIGFVLYTQWETAIDCYYKEEKTSRDYLIIGNYISSIVMMVSVFLLALFHTGIIRRNLTTLEWMERGRSQDYVNPYDVGPSENWEQVFGIYPLWWFVPTRYGIMGDGNSFPSFYGNRTV